MKRRYLFLCSIVGLFALNSSFAQSERALVRKGNTQYLEGNFSEAEVDYRKSINKNPESDLEAGVFNLGNALYEQDRFEEAASRYERAAEMAATPTERAEAFHNLGNALLKNSKLEESIEAYKNALRNNSQDPDTRYNLAYAQQLLKQQQEQQQQEQQEQEQNENQDQNEQEQNEENQQENENKEQNEENQSEEEQNKEKEQEEQEQQSQENKENEQQQEQQKEQEENEEKGDENQQQPAKQQESRELTKEEAARLLEALKNEELKVQQKLNRQKGKADRVRIEKDW